MTRRRNYPGALPSSFWGSNQLVATTQPAPIHLDDPGEADDRPRCRICHTPDCPDPLREDTVEHSVSSERITGYKVNHVVRHGDTFMFAGVGHGGLFEAEADAECHDCESHGRKVPDFEHSCGFNALSDRAGLDAYRESGYAQALLTVELEGRVIEHERGHRAARQRVLSVEFGDKCGAESKDPMLSMFGKCRDPAASLAVREIGSDFSVSRYSSLPRVIPVCSYHAGGQPELTTAELANRLGTEVTFTPHPDRDDGESAGAWARSGFMLNSDLDRARQIIRMQRARRWVLAAAAVNAGGFAAYNLVRILT